MLINFIKTDFNFSDDRGSLTQLVHDGWKQVNYITSIAGAIRGNHYHKENVEAFYVISGRFKLTAQKINDSQTEEYEMKAGDFFVVQPNINHSFEYLEDTQLISMYDIGVEKADGSKDIYSV